MLDFDPERHTAFLAGYMDAVGRALTTEETQYNLTARWLSVGEGAEEILDGKITHRQPANNWAKDLHTSCTAFSGTDGKDRLTFYLIEYICWYEEFGPEARAFKVFCSRFPDREIDSHLFLIDFGLAPSVLIIMSKLQRPPV